MRYDIEKSLEEILKRGEAIMIRKHKRAAALIGSLSGLTLGVIAAVFYSVADFSGTGVVSSSYGAFLLSREAGSYVLLGVICFILGAGISLGIMHFGRMHRVKGPVSEADQEGGCL